MLRILTKLNYSKFFPQLKPLAHNSDKNPVIYKNTLPAFKLLKLLILRLSGNQEFFSERQEIK